MSVLLAMIYVLDLLKDLMLVSSRIVEGSLNPLTAGAAYLQVFILY